MKTSALRRAMPGLSEAKARAALPHLQKAMIEGGITTRARAAAFIAQLGHESGSLLYMQELASGAAYEGRRDLGNTHPGDGRRYKGRGPIQLTGRANYRAAGKALHLDLEGNPNQAATYAVGFRIAAWYWKSRGLNAQADRGNFDTITRLINGGYNGKADRDYRHRLARAVASDLLPVKPCGLNTKEAKLVERQHYHAVKVRDTREGTKAHTTNLRWARWYIARIKLQMRAIQVAARRKGGGGWDKYCRGARYQKLSKYV